MSFVSNFLKGQIQGPKWQAEDALGHCLSNQSSNLNIEDCVILTFTLFDFYFQDKIYLCSLNNSLRALVITTLCNIGTFMNYSDMA